MITVIWASWSSQILREKVARRWENGELLFNGSVSVREDENVLEKHGGDGYSMMRTYITVHF